MSILIKGIEMPKNCLNCPMCNGNDECVLQSEEDNALFETWEEQKDGCPIVEVPASHGDLIDRNALIEFCAERWIPLNIDAVNMQPTVIEAEDGCTK